MVDHAESSSSPQARWVWQGALVFFVLAGLTGVIFRFGMAQGVSFGLNLGFVRHAHSHTMYFGWVTPALMALIASRLPELGGGRMPKVNRAIGLAFVTALFAYPPFLLFGYTPAVIGGVRLPLSMIMAGVNVLAWYAYVVMYMQARSNGPSPIALRLFDLAVFFLVLATLGAWGLSAMQLLGIDNAALRLALTHVFLDIFSEGWFVLGVLGLAASHVRLEGRMPTWGVRLVAVGIPFTFALGMPSSLVPALVKALASLGGMLTAVGLLLIGFPLWRKMRPKLESKSVSLLWRFALTALGCKALAEAAVSLTPATDWTGIPNLRIIYLHVVLLGFVSVGLVAAARSHWGAANTRGRVAFMLSVGVLLVLLLPFSPAWPMAWRGIWVLWMAAVAAVVPVVAAGWMLTSVYLSVETPPRLR